MPDSSTSRPDPKNPTEALIGLALAEDLDSVGDVTSTFFVPEQTLGRARIFVKEEPVTLSGITVAEAVFHSVDPALQAVPTRKDGDLLQHGDGVLTLQGSLRSILTAERTALNFLQHLSGIATLTRRFVDAVNGFPARILDTRKTTPGWRALEKAAVRHGGGTNHRFGLFDAVMVKDNHLLAKPGLDWLRERCDAARAQAPDLKIQLEADTLDQVAHFLKIPEVDAILLDNMSLEALAEAVRLRNAHRPEVTLEASGGVDLESVRGIAGTGVDFISAGALTHSVKAIDFSLEINALDESGHP